MPYWLGRGLPNAAEHGNRAYQAFHIVWPDPAGSFPWEAGYDEHCRLLQPALYLPGDDLGD